MDNPTPITILSIGFPKGNLTWCFVPTILERITPELASVPLCRTPLYFFVGRDHPMASATAHLSSFQDMPFYVTNCDYRTNRIISICAREQFFPANICNTANPYSTYLMAEMGSAVAFGSGFSTLHMNPSVRAYRLQNETVHLLCVYHPGQASPLTHTFVSFLSAAMRQCPVVFSTHKIGAATTNSL